ncbi:50S ribosomal protein L25 [Peptoniphilus sp.]|jgi:large subunit ribosomal protein L25|uniref:50S ribosomal protein L25 n=1 Tax=Peptoniphilus sp. TaxID=1971214 RepID=UPI003D9298BB
MKIVLQKRDSKGKNKVDKLRAEGIVPGVMYSKGQEAVLLKGEEKDLLKIFSQEGYSNIFEIEVDGKDTSVLFKEVQMHPIKNAMVHFDLFEIDMNEEITVAVPVVLEGRDDVRVQPSSLIQVINEIEVTCLPKYLPSEAVVNVVDMQIGDVMEIKDLDIFQDENIQIHEDENEVVASLVAPTDVAEEEAEEESADAADVPTVSETEDEGESEE